MAFNGSFSSQGRSFESIDNAPPVADALVQGIPMESSFDCPFGNSKIKSVMQKPSIGSSIARLLLSSRPAAVIGSVITVIVFSVKSHALFRLTHISKEIRKIKPAVTDFYSSAAVIRKRLASWVIASLFDSEPYTMQARTRHSMGSVCFMQNMSTFGTSPAPKASAGFRSLCLKGVSANFLHITAIALAQKINSFCLFAYNKISNSLPNIKWRNFFSRHKLSSGYRVIIKQIIKDVNYGF